MKELRDLKDLTIHDVQPISQAKPRRLLCLGSHQPAERVQIPFVETPDVCRRSPDSGDLQSKTRGLKTAICSHSHLQTQIHRLGSNQKYYTFALILLIKIVMCSEFH